MVHDTTRPVVVAGVAELDGGDPALLAAAGIAHASGAVLHLVHAYQLPRLFSMAPGLNIAFPEGADSYHDAVLGRLQGAAALEPAAQGAVCHVLEGSHGGCVLDVARQVGAALVVVGATRGSALRRAFLGTTAQRVLRESEVPVLVARGPLPRPLERVLLATGLTGFDAAVQATALATIEALLGRPRTVRALHVLPWSLIPPPADLSPVVDDGRAQLAEFLRRHPPQAEAVEQELEVGAPAAEIVSRAREWNADLVVVGTHARGWGERLLLGSVAEATLREATCNVLAVPPVRAAVPESEPAAEPEPATSSRQAWVEAVSVA